MTIINEDYNNVITVYLLKEIYLCFQSVWGSFWSNGKWGFKCCHSTIKESYCTGEAGREAAQVIIWGL